MLFCQFFGDVTINVNEKIGFLNYRCCISRDFNFFEANTKNISSNVLTIIIISRVSGTGELADILNT